MQRDESVILIKEIFDCCRLIEGKSIKLMPPNADSVFSKGCQIHVEARGDVVLEDCLKEITDSYGLAMSKQGESLIIYKPQLS